MYYNDLLYLPEAESKNVIKITAKKIDWRAFRAAAALYAYPSTYLDKIDGVGYLEKYNSSFMPCSGPYIYDHENMFFIFFFYFFYLLWWL